MKYEVIRYFTDLQDNNHAYTAGDIFPREGLVVTPSRIAELSGKYNKQHTPLIKLVEENVETVEPVSVVEPPAKPKYTKNDIVRMRKEDLIKLGSDLGIEDSQEKSGNELKKLIIARLGL